MAPSAPRASSDGRNIPQLPDRMESRRIPCFSRARTAVILSSPGQSSCLRMTQVGQVAATRSMTDTGMKSPLACGKSCSANGTVPIASTQFWKYVTIASSPLSPAGGAIITPDAPRSIAALVIAVSEARPRYADHHRQLTSASNDAARKVDRLIMSKLWRFAHHPEDGKSVGASLRIKIDQPIGAVEVEDAAFVKRRHRD